MGKQSSVQRKTGFGNREDIMREVKNEISERLKEFETKQSELEANMKRMNTGDRSPPGMGRGVGRGRGAGRGAGGPGGPGAKGSSVSSGLGNRNTSNS